MVNNLNSLRIYLATFMPSLVWMIMADDHSNHVKWLDTIVREHWVKSQEAIRFANTSKATKQLLVPLTPVIDTFAQNYYILRPLWRV